ncbi:MAG: tetratricopeptide repeat protein [Eubacteriales bacterium]|nr:tetratricopeptide repeat protein [Eubacteriales bacterium]
MDESEKIQERFERFCLEKAVYSQAEAIKELKSIIGNAKKLQSGQAAAAISFNHAVECYYYAYFMNSGDFMCAKTSLNRMYRELAWLYRKAGDFSRAKRAYEEAIQWNPVDPELYFDLAQLYKEQGSLALYLKTSQSAYNYCNSKPLLALYYRSLGFYYLESYQPELARALYEYSEVYSETQCAKMELEYLAQAMGWAEEKLEREVLVQRLKERNIPSGLNPITVALTYKAAKTEELKGHITAARECAELFFHQVFPQ